MSGYWIVTIVAFGIFAPFLVGRIVCGKKYDRLTNLRIAFEIVSLLSGVVLCIFMALAIAYPINANIEYENTQKRIQYAESLICETETEKFERDYILAEAKLWEKDVRYSIDKFGIFSIYYGIRDKVGEQ